jgi:glycosyltransferase involved in cell wall biosynthesis
MPNYLSRTLVLPKETSRYRQEMLKDLKPDSPIVLIYPTIAAKERLTMEILEAFKLLPPNFVCVTIAANDAYGCEIRQMAESKELHGRIKIYSPMPHEHLLNLIAAADMGAIFHDASSSSGNFLGNPMRLALFVAYAIPFVAVATPNIEALVYKHGLGLCCDPTDRRELADAIQHLVDSPPGLAARKQHLVERFANELNFEKHAAALLVRLEASATKRKQHS